MGGQGDWRSGMAEGEYVDRHNRRRRKEAGEDRSGRSSSCSSCSVVVATRHRTPFWLKVLFSLPESSPSTCGVFWWLLRGGGTRRRRFGASWRRSSWYPQSGGLNSCRMQLCWSVFRRQNFASLFKQASALREHGPTCVVQDWFFARWRLGPSSGFFSYSFP